MASLKPPANISRLLAQTTVSFFHRFEPLWTYVSPRFQSPIRQSSHLLSAPAGGPAVSPLFKLPVWPVAVVALANEFREKRGSGGIELEPAGSILVCRMLRRDGRVYLKGELVDPWQPPGYAQQGSSPRIPSRTGTHSLSDRSSPRNPGLDY